MSDNLPTTKTEFDTNLNRLDSLLQGLGITANVAAGSIESGVFGSNSPTTGIRFGVDPSGKTSFIQSRNFVSGFTGWRILSDGTAEFVSLTASGFIQVGGAAGDVNAGTTTISGGKITTNSIAAAAIITGQLIVGTNVGLGTAQDSFGVTTIIGNTVTTSYVNALSVVAGSVAAENITGTYITGKVIRSASSGNRIEICNNAWGDLKVIYWLSSSDIVQGYLQHDFTNHWTIVCSTGDIKLLSTGNVIVQGVLLPQTNSYDDIGSSSYKWKDLYLSGNIVVAGTVDGIDISAHAGNANAHHSYLSNGYNITPAQIVCSGLIQGSYFNMTGTVSYATRLDLSNFLTLPDILDPAVAAGKLYYQGTHFRGTDGTYRRDLCYYDERNAASPLPTFTSGINELKKIKVPDKTMNYNPDAFSDDYKLKINGEIDKNRLDLKPIIGMLIKSQKELLEKVELLESKII